tara:strand:+ start:4816 stop:5088 length:273 start_codon:yes stop_codon:yes gene_type:complete
VCRYGTCYCDVGYKADDCSVAPVVVEPDNVTPEDALARAAATLGLGFAIGLAVKVANDRRRRQALVKYIQETDAQAPFVSREVRQAVIGI